MSASSPKIAAFPGGAVSSVSVPAEELVSMATRLLDQLPVAQREQLLVGLLAKLRAGNVGPRSGEVLGRVIVLAAEKGQFSTSDLVRAITHEDSEATPKQVFNAVHYLARRGSLRRLGYGLYEYNGAVVATSDELGGELGRLDDLSNDVQRDRAATEIKEDGQR